MLLLKNAKIITVDDENITYGDILIDKGKIKRIGPNICEINAKKIDLKNMIVIPGLIDISTSIGLIESGVKVEVGSSNEKNQDSISGFKVLDGINFKDEYFEEALKSGVTTVVVSSGNLNALGAQSCVIKTGGENLEQRIISSFVDIKATLGDEPKKSFSRMGVVNTIRESLVKAKEYMEKKTNDQIEFEDYNAIYESLIPVIKGEIPLKITANRIQDILKAIELKNEFGISIIINGCAEGYMAIDELYQNEIPVILESLLGDNSSIENINRRDDIGNLLCEKGIKTSLSTHHPDINIELLLLSACLMAKNGMEYEDILKSITINPSHTLSLERRIGSIKVEKDADLVVLDGDPFKSMTNIIMTIIDGVIVYEK
ncbi:amidohydrolase family protein [Tissierella creatinophila]|uniref:Adenine deaminase n=1 Tax=Tissierella creatinophila DSM 6911 TaxID=1123403 RepID=A0A1U7M7B9_TISCR|nr:amidohydrolase family protein [Tissierella creatinophila]OLS03109.1 adenine deaminase [Tissierella creatinophila DSM 6911]